MDAPTLTLAAIVLGPVIVLMLLRINAALVFLSLCLGSVLVQYVASDARDLVTSLSSSRVTIHNTNATIKLFLLLLPVALTTVFMIRTVHGKMRLILNLLPAAGVGLLGALLVVPLLPAGLAHNVVTGNLWSQAQKAQDLIVSGSALVCLFVLWLQRPKAGSKRGKHRT